jgi:hypothetical protein
MPTDCVPTAHQCGSPRFRVGSRVGGPVGLAGVEQAADAVMSEVHQPERDALDAFRQVVHGFGWAIRDVGVVPRDDLVVPTGDGASESSDFWWHLGIGDVASDLRDPFGVREHRVDDRVIRRGQIERGALDPCEPRLVTTGDITDPVRVIDEVFTHGDDSVRHRMPPAHEVGGHFGDGTAVTPDLHSDPSGRPSRQTAAGRADLGVLVAPALPAPGATPALRAPHQPGRSTERREIDERNLAHTVTLHDTATRTHGPIRVGGDDDTEPQRPLLDTHHHDVRRANEERAHARSIGVQARASRDSTTSDIAENRRAPVPRPGPSRQNTPHLKRGEPSILSRDSGVYVE